MLTVDATGRVTAITASNVAIAASAVSGLAASATTDTTNATNITTGTLAAARLPTDPAFATLVAQTVTANSRVVSQSYESSPGSSNTINFGCDSNTSTINIGCGTSMQVVNVGLTGSGATTINVGGPGDTINISGTLATVHTTNTTVADKRITLNKGGAAGSAAATGLEIEEAGAITSYIQTSGTRDGFTLRAPAGTRDFTLNLASARHAALDAALHLRSTFGRTDAAMLDVANGPATLALLANSATGAYNRLVAGGDALFVFHGGAPDTATNLVIAPWTSGSNGLKLSGQTGHFGIGCTPAHALDVAGSNICLRAKSSTSNDTMELRLLSAKNDAVQRQGFVQRIGFYGRAEYVDDDQLDASIDVLMGSNIHIPVFPGNSSTQFIFSTRDWNSNLAERMRLTPTGDLLIGTSFAAYAGARLDVFGTTLLRNGNLLSASGSNQLLFGWAGSNAQMHAIKTRHNATANEANNAIDMYVWQTSDAPTAVGSKHVMSVTSKGVGVFTTSPEHSVHVVGSARVTGALEVARVMRLGPRNLAGDDNAGVQWSATNTSATASASLGYADFGANVGSGWYFRYNGADRYVIRFDGETSRPSDATLKIVRGSIPDPLAVLDPINPVYYHWKDRPDGHRLVGVLAQEVEQTLPEAVSTQPSGIKYVSYDSLVPVVVGAVRQLRSKHDALRADNDALRGQHDALRGQHDALHAEYDALRAEYDALRGQYDALRADVHAIKQHVGMTR